MTNIEAWHRDAERRLKPRTVAAYRGDIEALATYANGRLDELGFREIQSWLEARGGDAKTFARRYSSLKSYFGFLVRKGWREGNPMDRVVRPRNRRNAPQTIPDAHHRIAKLDEPYRSIAVLIYETGMSKGEVFALDLRRQHLGDEILVDGRSVRLTYPARKALSALGGRIPRDKGMSARAVERRFQIAGVSARGLRHTFADELAEQGADLETIAEALGLSLASARLYARPTPALRDRVRQALERRIRAR